MIDTLPTPERPSTGWTWSSIMAFVRLPLFLFGNGVVIQAYRQSGYPAGLSAGVAWATLSITLINILCLGLLLWRLKIEAISLADIIGFERRQLLSDIVQGVAWSFGLFVLLLCGVFAAIFILQLFMGPISYEQLFVGDADFSFNLPSWLALISATIFPLLNAPLEEIWYRGYVQPRMIALSGSLWLGILITSTGFGLQHIIFSLTLSAYPVYVAGFFLWGIGAGMIAYQRKRLISLIIAHFISNLAFGIIPLVFVLLQGT